MSLLTQQFMQNFLMMAFSITDPTLVVPKQGNWFNPQSMTSGKPSTWCAYLIKRTRDRTLPYYEIADDGVSNQSTVPVISDIDIQLVGSGAEIASLSVSHWLNRQDLKDYLRDNGMQLVGRPSESITSHFMQDGMNNVLAYNRTFSIQWDNYVTSTAVKLTDVTLPLTNGTLTIP
jgi:hypothetical protein